MTTPGSREAEERSARAASIAPADTLTPGDRYQELFVAVQMQHVFADSKTFVDCAPRKDPEEILGQYRAVHGVPGFDLAAFVAEHFETEHPPVSAYIADDDRTLREHIDHLWDALTREPHEHPTRSSLLPLPHPYLVPGGRFSEMYYWDSYFTMLGLVQGGRRDLLRNMADNFAYLIDTYGHVPNGNRSYYLSRSQPPVFALMTELFEENGVSHARRYLPQLLKEHSYWMNGAEELRNGEVHRHCVRMQDGSLLNRYWDDRDTPREESYSEDVTTASLSQRPRHEVYRDLRAGAASGWDFSSRWCAEPGDLSTIRTTSILPVDLNSFLHRLERQIAKVSVECGDDATAERFQACADQRQAAIDRWHWDDAAGQYLDFDWARDERRGLTAATVTPLFSGIASKSQAARVVETVREQLLVPRGLLTTLIDTGEQWDRPNGWAPLHWMAIDGFWRSGHQDLARDIARHWLRTVGSVYERDGELVEKYDLETDPEGGCLGGGGGEYPLQHGFGWTNGVTRRLLEHDESVGEAQVHGPRD